MIQYKLLIDTCVWLDLVKAHDDFALDVLESLILERKIALIVPQIVIDEFQKNKSRVIKESTQGLTNSIRRVRDILMQFGDLNEQEAGLELLNNIDFKIPTMDQYDFAAIRRIEKLFENAEIVEASIDVKLRAVDRAIAKSAPFHRTKNSINDAIIIGIYESIVLVNTNDKVRFAFITHNTNDFSTQSGDQRNPHPDLEKVFPRGKAFYFIQLSAALQKISPQTIDEVNFQTDLLFEKRSLKEIAQAEADLSHKVWYNRHKIRAEKIASGEIRIILRKEFDPRKSSAEIVFEIWEGALAAASGIEKEYGLENLGPWDDFEWGMINGKLSALRWVTGDDWDVLDT